MKNIPSQIVTFAASYQIVNIFPPNNLDVLYQSKLSALTGYEKAAEIKVNKFLEKIRVKCPTLRKEPPKRLQSQGLRRLTDQIFDDKSADKNPPATCAGGRKKTN